MKVLIYYNNSIKDFDWLTLDAYDDVRIGWQLSW